MTEIHFHLAPEDADLAPRRQHPDDAGYDLRARSPMTIAPGAFAGVPTGLRLELPEGWMAEVRPRSGLALRHGVTILNAPGTIDAGYRGEVQAILVNHGSEPFVIQRGDRIAQLIFVKLPATTLCPCDSLSSTLRGEGGFGSTGTT